MTEPHSSVLDGQNIDALLGVLDRLRDTGPEYGGFLANHGPMAADAIIRLGGHGQVEDWVDRYRTKLLPRVPGGDTVSSKNWMHHLGDVRALGDWNEHFTHATAEHDWHEVLEVWWPRLLPGAAASAAHGLIRTAHAVRNLAEADRDEPLLVDELARGLAYWAARYQLLPGAPRLAGRLNGIEATARLPRLPVSAASVGPGVGGRLTALIQIRELPDALDRWGPAPDAASALDEIIGAAARVLAARDNDPIALCHAVTAPAAVRMILPSLPPDLHDATVAATWQVTASIISAFAAPPHAAERSAADQQTPDRAELARTALAHGDEHVIKLTEAALRQHGRTGDPTLLIAAERFQHRIEVRP